ncbi:MAG: prepilin-type N-terminal cleavage/methylation domain-containing protein [Planctomycetota bacterium]
MNRLIKKGFTIVELLVVVSIIALLIAILLPAIGKARDSALVTTSLANLRNLSAACGAYGADYSDRQYTAVPDEAGMYGDAITGACTAIVATQCIPQMILGWDSGGGLWGYWVAGGPARCAGWPGNCGNFVTYVACDFWGASARWEGAWRLTNCKAFNSYVGGKFYDKVFWAPKDKFTLQKIEKYFITPVEFNYTAGAFETPTYVWSPAAMWSPDVMAWSRRTGNGTSAVFGAKPTKTTLPGAFKSPGVGMASYPSLKWRMWEHQWLQNPTRADINPAFSTPTPWFYNESSASAPAMMAFDGHTQVVSIAGIQQDNDLLIAQSAGATGTAVASGALWFGCSGGANGYFNSAAYDMLTTGAGAVNAGVLTTDGINGRDMNRIGD